MQYIAAYTPLQAKADRIMEMINECLTITIIYFYMLMSDARYDSDQKYYIGLAHVFSTLSMLVLNLLLLLRSMGIETIPQMYEWFKETRDKYKMKGVLEEWIKEKKEKMEGDKDNYVLQKQYFEL